MTVENDCGKVRFFAPVNSMGTSTSHNQGEPSQAGYRCVGHRPGRIGIPCEIA